MADFMNFVVMLFAAVAAMLFGVLASFAIFRFGFWCMNPERKLGFVKTPVKTSVKTA